MPGLSEADTRLLDQFLDVVLQQLLDGFVDQVEARQSLKKAFVLVAAGNPNVGFYFESEMRGLLDQGRRAPP